MNDVSVESTDSHSWHTLHCRLSCVVLGSKSRTPFSTELFGPTMHQNFETLFGRPNAKQRQVIHSLLNKMAALAICAKLDK